MARSREAVAVDATTLNPLAIDGEVKSTGHLLSVKQVKDILAARGA